jgi:putative ABC transport system permease protein
MNLVESFRIALRSLTANKLRAGLTMLGVIIGVAAVIALMSIGRGASAAISNQIQSIGTNLLFVRPGSSQSGGVRGAEGSAGTLTLEDGEALNGLEGIVAVAPEIDSFAQIVYQGNNANARLLGVTPEYSDATNALAAEGDFINAAQVTAKSLVTCLGSGVAGTLFPDTDPVGQTVRVNNVPLRVVCVMQSKGGTGFLSQDSQIFVPLTTAQARLGRGGGGQRFRGGNNVDVLNIKLTSQDLSDQVTQEIGDVLRQRHHVTFQDDFTITSQQDILSAATTVTNTLTIFLGGIAAISLVVGGIGIMNIMLVSVTERTREIGIRKAVGAKRRDILMQFLTEATVLSVLGGIIGTAIGIGIALSLGRVSLGNSQITPVVDTTAIILAVVFSIAVGLFFGIYPALRASSLKPIDALRYE